MVVFVIFNLRKFYLFKHSEIESDSIFEKFYMPLKKKQAYSLSVV